MNALQESLQKKSLEELIQTLSSEKSVLLTLKSQLQEKSELIVKMKGADLILKENAQLKEKSTQASEPMFGDVGKIEDTINQNID